LRTARREITTQKSAVLTYFAAEARNHDAELGVKKMLQYRVSLPTVQAKGGTAIPKHTHLSLDLLFTCYLPLYNHLLTYIISECSLCQDGHATWLAETRNAHRILEGNPLRYRLQGDLENVGECDHVGCEGKILQ